MHPVAEKCVGWGVGCAVLGGLLMAFGPAAFAAIAQRAGPGAETGLTLLNVVLLIVQLFLMPLGAGLIAAAVVVNTLAGPSSGQRPWSGARDEGE